MIFRLGFLPKVSTDSWLFGAEKIHRSAGKSGGHKSQKGSMMNTMRLFRPMSKWCAPLLEATLKINLCNT